MKNSFLRNVSHSILAQIVSLITGFTISLIVPKFISEIDYSYWQTYLLFATYIGIFHFGIFDGMYLRYGEYDNNELDKKTYRSQLNFVFCTNVVIGIIFILSGIIFFKDYYQTIIYLLGFSLIIRNIFTYTNYVFQITNRIKYYAYIVIADRFIYLLFIVIFLFSNLTDFYWIIIADLIGVLLSIGIGYKVDKSMYTNKLNFDFDIHETGLNLISGYKLLFANLISLSLIGITKLFVIIFWDDVTFGKIAFSFNMTNIVLGFVLATGIVLFPTLKRMSNEKVISLYPKVRNIFIPLLFISILSYFPLKLFLDVWLPNYAISLQYLGILMPIVIFEARVTLLTNNYLKVFRKEKAIFIINFFSLLVSLILLTISSLLHNLHLVVISLLIVLILRSTISEIIVSKIVKKQFVLKTIFELVLTSIFVYFNYVNLNLSFSIYTLLLVVYLYVFRQDIFTFLTKNKKE